MPDTLIGEPFCQRVRAAAPPLLLIADTSRHDRNPWSCGREGIPRCHRTSPPTQSGLVQFAARGCQAFIAALKVTEAMQVTEIPGVKWRSVG
jgi:hypothetical protein